MGLIKAAAGAGGGVLADQWKEYFYCDAINADVLAVKGRKKVTKRSSNTKGDEDIITQAFGVQLKDHTCFLPGVVSRKKQVIPMLTALWG